MSDLHSETKLDYVELPILVQVDLRIPGPLRPYLVTGPAVAWNAGEDRETAIRFQPTAAQTIQRARIFEDVGTFDGNLGARQFDAGAVGGLGLVVTRGRTRLGLEGRYTHGLINVLAGRDEAQLRNSAFAITAVVEF